MLAMPQHARQYPRHPISPSPAPMSEPLPQAIDAYIQANARMDIEGMLRPFAASAEVIDDGGHHTGHDELRAWIKTATVDNDAVFVPQSWSRDGAEVIVDGVTSGNFKGSPISLTMRFALQGAQITRLVIG